MRAFTCAAAAAAVLAVGGCATAESQTVDSGLTAGGNAIANTVKESIARTAAANGGNDYAAAAGTVLAEPGAIPSGYTAAATPNGVTITSTTDPAAGAWCVAYGPPLTTRAGTCPP